MASAFISYRIEDRSFVSYIKREIHSKALQAGFPEARVGEIDIIVSEITSNLVKHAGSGELLYRIQAPGKVEASIEILSIDSGSGISDVARMMRDGMSTASTLGQGLGAIDRLSNIFQIYSLAGWGTIVYSLVTRFPKIQTIESVSTRPASQNLNAEINALFVTKAREIQCGDGYRVKQISTGKLIFFGDGLGHGEGAFEAVEAAGNFFQKSPETDPIQLIRAMHDNIRKTRGLVGTIVSINTVDKELVLCGIGNIHTRLFSGMESRNFISYNGTIGLNIPNSINLSRSPLEKNQHLIMASDGIMSRWDLSRYPTVFRYHNMILAAAIYKDFTRRTDDASVLVAKIS